MRPVERGAWPTDSGGKRVVFRRYVDARRDLISRLGPYCSYCEARLPASLAVEHCQPKSLRPARERDWNNFLLACANCNSIKSAKPIRMGDYLWPDAHNTFLAADYGPGALVAPATGLTPPLYRRMRRLIDLVGLDRNPGNDPTASDRRWQDREEVWGVAEEALASFLACNTPQVRRLILRSALGYGHWSIWMTVFRNQRRMLRLFVRLFPGTDPTCFGNNGNALPRPGAVM